MNNAPIGVFDSGVGGLSVLRAIWEELPREKVIYVADQAHVPYGSRPMEEVRDYAFEITQYLLAEGSKLIVLACNTASAAALHALRKSFPQIPFIGMEPAVKPAAEKTHTGVVGVLATPATFQGELYASVVERFAKGVEILTDTCSGLVQLIENGDLSGEQTTKILNAALKPMLTKGIDTVVLGCTHYPFVIPLIENIAGPEVRVIDPAPAVARQVRRVLSSRALLATESNEKVFPTKNRGESTRFITSGSISQMQHLVSKLLGVSAPIEQFQWNANKIISPKK